jgi:Mor family transcriptional regulator
MSKDRLIEIPEEYLPKIEELPGDLQLIARLVEEVWHGYGVRVAIILGQLLPGVGVYIHNVKELARRIRNDAIRKEYDRGVRVKELAITYRLSTRQIENILAEPPSQEELKSKQYRLF